jgi:hypothetical protein
VHKKYSAVEATEHAATAIANNEFGCSESNRFDRMMEMKSSSEYYNKKANMFKQKIFEKRDNGETEEMLEEIKTQRKHAKKMLK